MTKVRATGLTAAMTSLLVGAACKGPVHETASAAHEAPPSQAPADAKEPVALATAELAAQPTEDPVEEEGPSLAAYPPAQIENLIVRRKGRTVQLIARLGRVPGARRYEIEVARTLMFGQLVTQGAAAARVVTAGPISPGLFFARARAVGSAGEGPFGDVRVVDANKGGAAKLTTVQFADSQDDPPIVAAPPAPPGSAAPVIPATPPTPPAPPTPAAAMDAGVAPTRVADDAQLRLVRQRYDRLRRDLADLETLRNEVKAKLQNLQGRLAGSDAKSAASLEEDLRVIEASRRQLEREIASSLAELDRAKL